MEYRNKLRSRKELNREIRKRNLITIACYISFFAFIVYFSISFLGTSFKIKDLNTEISAKNEKKESLIKQKLKLEKELKEVDDDKWIEKVAREKLKMVSKDDLIYVDESKNKNENNEKRLYEDN